uniref:proline rich 29 isoform 3 n=1 Tax=Rattus norvegicus TaxID=10116 RepID=UPI0031B7F03F
MASLGSESWSGAPTQSTAPTPWVTILQPLPWTVASPQTQHNRVKEEEMCPHLHPRVRRGL